MHDYNIDEVLL